ncbi:Rieske (2Fe-2S) protein [Salinarchaeum laminariae]|uniref:Rieske (2Fe-2S) protein n=1 Tax=Salinarchaeum laminariae TaxID=869888 RepID=UPI0020BEA8BF|nr:Rieske 2Fe-2S domain-containing protein [Salinarchaeum laminariae]
MAAQAMLTTVEHVDEEGSFLFTVADDYGVKEEVILVPCEDGVEAWHNRCTHEDFRLDRGFGVIYREGEIVCAKHGSTFDTCSGFCDNGDAKDTTLPHVEVACEDGDVVLVDENYTFLHEGGIDDGDDGDGGMPGSTSSIGF